MTKVLVVDDEMPLRLLCRYNLEAEGMAVVEAADGLAALEQARKEQPSIILLNVRMPDIDGWQVAEMLFRDPTTREIPIVFMSALTGFGDRARSIEIGGIDYLTKPFDPTKLEPVLSQLLVRVKRGERDELREERLGQLRALFRAG